MDGSIGQSGERIMEDLTRRIASLSPQQRTLLEAQVKQRGLNPIISQVIPRRKAENLSSASFNQEYLWFIHQLEPDNAMHNLSNVYRIRGSLDVAVLEQCLNEIMRRQEILRTSFVTINGHPMQHVVAAVPMNLSVVDLQEFAETDREHVAQQRAVAEARQLLDLIHGPLFHAVLLRLKENEFDLLVTMHHIITDWWSFQVFEKELAALYIAFSAQKPSPLAELRIQFADYAVWQRQWLQGSILEEQLTYWKKQLNAAPEVLRLPTDRPRPRIRTFRGARLFFVLSKEITQGLKILSHREETTLFMTTLAALATLFYRYTGQDDILIGSPNASRNRAGTKELIGFFMDMFVLRTDLSGNPGFRELLRRVRRVALDAYAHPDVPFGKLIEELHVKRNVSYTPLFQVMFIFLIAKDPDVAFPGLLHSMKIDNGAEEFDLTISMWERTEDITGRIEYNTDLFDEGTIQQMLDHFQVLLEGIVANPEQRISKLPLLLPSEHQLLLHDWNNTQKPLPADVSLPHLIELQVSRTPDALAVVYGQERLNYAELNQRANQLARYLQSLGIGTGVKVGICMERSLEMIVGLLGVLKAGGVYVPIDPVYPTERQIYMLEDSKVGVLLTQKRFYARVSRYGRQVLCLDTDWERIGREHETNLVGGNVADNLAYIIYTSGSTGQPKGVGVYHKGLANLLYWFITEFSITSRDSVLLITSLSFDLTQKNIFAPLMVGGTLYLQTSDYYDPHLIVQTIFDQQITILNCTPSAFYILIDANNQDTFIEVSSLRCLFLGGEAIFMQRLQKWLEIASPKTEIVNTYGPTECTDIATYYRLKDHRQFLEASVPIGKPILNVKVLVLDKNLCLLPIGAVGELCISGSSVGYGYINDPELTSAKFPPDPFSEIPSMRLYKTGDLGRYLPDGSLEFLGRSDDQVKIRGFRIELREIEVVLSQHPAVQESVVIAKEAVLGNMRLVAYVVSHKTRAAVSPDFERELQGVDLRQFLQELLPLYMLPTTFIFLDGLPLTPNGKIDRMALEQKVEPIEKEGIVYPRTIVEKKLASIWVQVLGREQVGITDNFFELGGDSILSIQVLTMASEAGFSFSLRQLFEHQTIAELAAIALPTTDIVQKIHSGQKAITGPISLTPVQHWFFEQKFHYSHHWNQSVLLEVPPDFSLFLFEQVTRSLLEHHDVLRSHFVKDKGAWRQVISVPGESAHLLHRDLSSVPFEEIAFRVEAIANQVQASFRLAEGPLVKFVYFQFASQNPGRLLIVIHHLIFDAVSWRILLQDLQTAYRQLSKKERIQLPPKTSSFKMWTEQLEAYSQSNELGQEIMYWLALPWQDLAPLPMDIPVGANTHESAHSVEVFLSIDETRALLQEAPRRYTTQINDLLITALVQAFIAWMGGQTLLIDLEGHGREDIFSEIDLSRTVGWFTSIFPVLLNIKGASHKDETLQHIKEQLRAIPNKGLSYGALRYLSRDPTIRMKCRSLPSAQVVFSYLGQLDQILPADSAFKLTQESRGQTQNPQEARSYLLEIEGRVIASQFMIRWRYSENIHRRATIEALARRFLQALRELILYNPMAE